MSWLATIPKEIEDRLTLILGSVLLATIGRDRFYYASQGSGALAELARRFAEHRYLHHIIDGWREIRSDKNQIGRTAASKLEYADSSLGG